MALFGTGSTSQYWQATREFDGIGRRPFFISVWTKGSAANNGANQGFASFASSASATPCIGPYIGSASSIFAFDEDVGGTLQQATAGTSSVANAWQNIICTYANVSSRFIYINGGTAATDSNTLSTTQALNRLLVGSIRTNSGPLSTTRSVAEIIFGTGILSADQRTALAAGANPLVVLSAAQILAYYPLRGDLNDLGPLRTGLTPIGGAVAVWGEHPPVVPRLRRRRLPAPSTTISSSVGTATGTATVSGTGAATANATGTATGTAAASAAGASIGASAGAATGSGAATATGASLAAATGAATGSSDVQGVGLAPDAATGTATGDSTVVGIGAATAQAVATAAGAGDVAGVAAAFGIATGTASGASAVLGTATSIHASVGTATGCAVVIGMGQVPVAATGTITGSSAVSGVGIAFNPAWSAAGTLTGSSAVTGVARSIAKGIGRAAGQSVLIGFSGSIERRKGIATLPADKRAARLPHDSRTAIARGAMTNLEFPRPKDPADSGIYAIHSPEPISSVERVAVSAIGPTATQGVWRTPGDAIAGSPLTASGWTVASDGMGVEFRLQGGAPGIAYAIRAAFTTASGSFVNRSAVLRVTGL